jgi:hypothetical protein
LGILKYGKRPEEMGEEEGAAYDAASEMVSDAGPLTAGVWKRAVERLWKRRAIALMHFRGFMLIRPCY